MNGPGAGDESNQDSVLTPPTRELRKHSRTRWLALFVAAWVSLGVQPCAVAAVAEKECPHCPTESEAPVHPVESHCNPAGKADTDEPPDCDAVQAQCCDLDEGIVNGRADLPDWDDDSPALVVSEPFPDPGFEPRKVPANAVAPPDPRAGTVPLHVLNCVYLD